MFILNKKDIVAFNKEFSDGNFINERSLDFAIDAIKYKDRWIKSLAFLTRAIVLDHVFQDGNKRTAALVIKFCVEYYGYKIDNQDLYRLLLNIAKRRLSSIEPMERRLEYVIRKDRDKE